MDNVNQSLEKSRQYLASSSALASIQRDPYWPKWDSPWWHMSLFFELGLAHLIPHITVAKMVSVLREHYLPIFPIEEAAIPVGTCPYRQIACLCAIGNIYQVLFACGVDVDRELPWMRPWFCCYQLPDGGLNCDEQAYRKLSPKSSIVSTISCLEAVLFSRQGELTSEEVAFLHRGAKYLVEHRLFRKISTGEIINQDWTEVRFPRFYDYDFLRGFYFLAKWREYSNFVIPAGLEREVKELVGKQMVNDGIKLLRYNLIDGRSFNPQSDG